jgi:signal transduction histidine kinase
MDYAVGPPLDLAPVDAAELVEIYCRPPALPHDIRIKLQAEAELRPALIDRDRFAQALANLVNNAVEAMPMGGPIDIRTENVILEPAAEAPILPPGPYLKITIQDRGIGIPARHLTRVFDPYFTTKRQGKGMGLAIAFAIVKRHRGTITVESEPGQGATFTIYFPAAATKNNGRPDCSDSPTPSKTQAA